ncbi:MAG: hypothetical protein JJLCMIEE_01148 [Acidimicrobiales bacterium]|nr:MAG: ABC transporter permease [Actinomycetota bacterium]MBV6508088.1 hypothetical protein [Acidimicrobiales bacterium]RIK05288.1 MAG: hypothetical protein DCC48_10425 [Acidobacteriota bacterium]
MRNAFVIAGNDLHRRLRDRSVLIQGVVGPLVLATIISFAFSGFDTFKVDVALVDEDQTVTSAAIVDGLVEAVNEGEGEGLEIREVATAAEARRMVDDDDDDVGGMIVLPRGFCESLRTEPLPIGTVINEESQFAGEVTESLAGGIAGRVDLARVAVNTALRVAAGEGEFDKVADLADDGCGPATSATAGSGAGVEVQPAIVVADQSYSGEYNAVSYYGPGMAILFAFFAAGIGARSILGERREGTLVRVRAAPVTDRTILFGKTVGVATLALSSIVIVWIVTSLALAANWGPIWGALLVIVCVVVAIAGLSMLVTALARTEAQADGFTAMLALGLALLGGSFISPGGLPPLLQEVSAFTPNGMALHAFTDLAVGGAGLAGILPHLAGLITIGACSGIAALVLLQRKVLS